MLYHERKRLQEIKAAEAEGASFWTEEFSPEVRNKIWHAFNDTGGNSVDNSVKFAHQILVRSLGVQYLYASGVDPAYDLGSYLLSDCENNVLPSVIEAMQLAHNRNGYIQKDVRDAFREITNTILRNNRIAFELVEDQVVPLESQELHSEVVVPTLLLLSGRPNLSKVESAYQDALREIAAGHAADAITDAGTALQESLEALGCEGNALGPLIKSARSKGLVAAHDQKLLDWVSADRSESGDGHHSTSANIDDAWLIVHVVGAIVLRITGSPRSKS